MPGRWLPCPAHKNATFPPEPAVPTCTLEALCPWASASSPASSSSLLVPVMAARWAKWLRVVASACATCTGSASEAVAKSRIRAACWDRAASVLPEITHGTTGSAASTGMF